jgi:electron transfer flavoprotein beta subunit
LKMKTVVCYKWVVSDDCISVSPSGNLEFKDVEYDISEYDRNAVEAATQLAERTEGLCVALSAGDETLVKSQKATLSAGPKEGYVVIDPIMDKADCMVTANVLAEAVRKIGEVDLVLCGEASSDTFSQQMAPRIARELGWPVATYVKEIEPGNGYVTVTRELEACVEKLELRLPAVVSILGDSNTPRMPKLKDVMSAGKKPFTRWTVADLGVENTTAGLEIVSLAGNSTDRKTIILEEDSLETTMEKLLKSLIEEGVVG